MAVARVYKAGLQDEPAAPSATTILRRDNTNTGYGRSNTRTNDSGYGRT